MITKMEYRQQIDTIPHRKENFDATSQQSLSIFILGLDNLDTRPMKTSSFIIITSSLRSEILLPSNYSF